MAQERHAQKARTREALLTSARELLAEDEPVTVASAAARAGMSKATAYRYFSDPALLVAEAGLAVKVKPYAEVVAGARTPREKVRALSVYFFDLALDNEAAFRSFLARTLDVWEAEGGTPHRIRGARRVAMFEAALASVADDLGPARSTRLVAALAATTGSEAMIALLDVAELDRDVARQTVREMADGLLDAYLGVGTAG